MTDLTEQWVNIYKSKKHGSYWTGAFCYKTKEEAVKDLADKEHYLTTVNIEDMLNLQTQNKQLKELLRECKQWFDWYHIDTGTGKEYIESWHKKGHEIHKQLDEVLK